MTTATFPQMTARSITSSRIPEVDEPTRGMVAFIADFTTDAAMEILRRNHHLENSHLKLGCTWARRASSSGAPAPRARQHLGRASRSQNVVGQWITGGSFSAPTVAAASSVE
jgi:hypothetical protein